METQTHPASGTSLNQGQFLKLSDSYQAGVVDATFILEIGSELKIAPFGNGSLVYIVCRSEAGYHLTTKRVIADKGEDNYQKTFASDVVLDLPQNDELNLVALIDRCSSELLLQQGEFCVTDLSFDSYVSGYELTCIKGAVKLERLNFCAQSVVNPIIKAA
jgi:fructan beta-fructosidase